jgi:hypothetical protein
VKLLRAVLEARCRQSVVFHPVRSLLRCRTFVRESLGAISGDPGHYSRPGTRVTRGINHGEHRQKKCTIDGTCEGGSGDQSILDEVHGGSQT